MDTEQRIQDLENQVRELKETVTSLSQAASIPVPIELAFREKGFIVAAKPDYPDVNGAYLTNTGFRQSINTAGGPVITVPGFPTRYLRIKDTNLYIPVHTFSQL